MKVDILGVKIDDITMAEALAIVEKWIWNPGKHYIVTPNPEFLVAAQKDPVFKKILNSADLAIPDGVGLKLSGKIKNTFSGTDFMESLVSLAAEKGFTAAFLGGREGVAEKCAERLKSRYPKLKILLASNDTETKIPPCDLLFVALGHIKQEKWIAENLDKIPAHVAMGVGGAFDYLGGFVPRAPVLIRSLGLEWLFRLIIQPWRIKRQMALIKYLWLIAS
ncbi:WecB/TagA/CpsF family glycosyltransferase [Candidatus Daviesbacteria bacterium]|nr:WecB/TagA/CpsF family glycosyltransferase [Candidatus Daviesbacteria bacterium]